MSRPNAPSFADVLAGLVARRDLAPAEMEPLVEAMVGGALDELETATLLVALRMKGERAAEIAAAAAVLRRHMLAFDTGRDDILDTCGTGGDDSGTFNISTATALVAAGAGVPVVKHGNRAVSSHSGSMDVLGALGVEPQAALPWVRRCLERAGLAFCFAQHFHPTLRNLSAVRKRLRVRTLFNCLGPLLNPARAPYQLIGVGRPDLLDPMAGAVAGLGTRHAFLVCGTDGLDEVTLSGATLVREVRGNEVLARKEWSPADFGLAPSRTESLRVTGPAESAAVITAVLTGADGPATNIVLANAAAALVAADRCASLKDGVALARDAITTGRARGVLDRLIACAPAPDPTG